MRQASLRDISTDNRERRHGIAKASLRECWELAESSGVDTISDEEIYREIAEARNARSVPIDPSE